MTIDTISARTFIYAEARVLEQRLYEAVFEKAGGGGVVAALAGFRIGDGGFGFGLEPDKRGPTSQPLDVEVALERLVTAEASAPDLVAGACDYLATVAEPDGPVPIAFADILDFPHAAHWDEIPLVAGMNPTASIAGYLHALGATHPWLDQATEWCFRSLETDGPPREVHGLRCATRFLEHAPDRDRAAACAGRVAAALPAAPMYQAHPADEEYGLSPLEFATAPGSFASPWFDDDVIQAHLDHLEAQQQPDGGWTIQWEPPSTAARCDWRGIVTMRALEVLAAYDRLG